MKPELALIGGGARTGKSSFALKLAHSLGKRPALLATAEGLDDEMRERIAHHRQGRDPALVTVEEPINVAAALQQLGDHDVVILDCLTLWLSNLIQRGLTDGPIIDAVDKLAAGPFHLIVVTNEVGMGLVPETALGRRFRDLAGRAHQSLAARADRIYFGAIGAILRLKPRPMDVI